MHKIHRIKLTQDEREELELIRSKGSHKALKYKRASILLLSDESAAGSGLGDEEISQVTASAIRTIERLRKRCCEVGPLGALEPKPRENPPTERKITGEVEASITQLACSEPPKGTSRWTLQLLANRLVEINVIESISHTSVGLVLKKARSSHGVKKDGASRRMRTPPS